MQVFAVIARLNTLLSVPNKRIAIPNGLRDANAVITIARRFVS